MPGEVKPAGIPTQRPDPPRQFREQRRGVVESRGQAMRRRQPIGRCNQDHAQANHVGRQEGNILLIAVRPSPAVPENKHGRIVQDVGGKNVIAVLAVRPIAQVTHRHNAVGQILGPVQHGLLVCAGRLSGQLRLRFIGSWV